jgi:mRNA-degrading endonuclease YafQ of YafQ-DinJ toxin-antitoxin module
VNIYYSPRFIHSYKKLSINIKEIVKKKEIIFRADPFDQRLKSHKLNGEFKDYWSFSVNYEIRIIFKAEDNQNFRFELIGDHDIY